MCLDKITKVYKPTLFNLWIPRFAYKSGVGWKNFINRDNLLYPLNFNSRLTRLRIYLKVNLFLDEKDYRPVTEESKIDMYGGSFYNSGWHIYLEKPHYFATKVEYKGGRTLGVDSNKKVIVAKYMKILP